MKSKWKSNENQENQMKKLIKMKWEWKTEFWILKMKNIKNEEIKLKWNWNARMKCTQNEMHFEYCIQIQNSIQRILKC